MTTSDIYEMDVPAQLRVVIKHFTGINKVSDNDVKVVLGQNLILFKNKGHAPNADYPSIIELINPDNSKNLGLSSGKLVSDLFTRFDGKPLSRRSDPFPAQVAELFVGNVLTENETSELTSINSEDVRFLVALSILEDAAHLERYLRQPDIFLTEVEDVSGIGLLDEQREQFVLAAGTKQSAIRDLFDYAELGQSIGDGDTYVLVGAPVDEEGVPSAPTAETMAWLQQFLADFVERYGYLPAYGSYVTEAALRQRVIMGPGVTDREKEYIENNVFDHHDCREWGSVLDLNFD